jgi:hypothetical protein
MLLTFSGTVTASTEPGISIGVPYSGEILYDTTDTMVDPAPSEFYLFGANDHLAITVGGCTFTGSGPGTSLLPNGVSASYHQVFNGQSVGDLFEAVVNSSATSSCPAFSPYELYFQIVGSSGLLTSDGIPSALDLSQVAQPSYSGYGTGAGAFFQGSQFFSGNFTSLQLTDVPEPSELTAIGAILCGLVFARRRLPL